MTIKQNFNDISKTIIDTKSCVNRTSDLIKLLAVSKTRTAAEIKTLYGLGQVAFGESYLQEALSKQQELLDCHIEWHFIGPIQSNKTSQISHHFNWVHSLCREKIAKRLNDARSTRPFPLNVLVQVNINQENNKEGLSVSQVSDFCQSLSQLPHLTLRGLMAIPQKSDTFEEQCKHFSKLHDLYKHNQKRFQFDTLSMGMSTDYQAAIAEGSTLLRIGSLLFGEPIK